MQRYVHPRLQTKIDLFVGLLFVVLSTISIAPPVAADSDCVTEDQCQHDGDGNWVKIKRLEEFIDFEWDGGETASGDSCVNAKKQFCTIAFTEGKKRDMHNVITWIEGDNSNDSYELAYNGKMPVEHIPVEFKIESYGNSAEQPLRTYKHGAEVILESNDDFDLCKKNELILSVTVLREDILETGTAGTYTNSFTFYSKSENTQPGEAAHMDFRVTLEVEPVIQISGLKDLTLEVDNNIARKEHNFCVFAMGKEKFTLEASSDVGNADKNGRFNLKMDGSKNYLEYQLIVSDADNNSKTYYTKDTLGGFTPSNNYLCTDNFNPNMTVEITTHSVTKIPAGEYSDIMTFTVVPE